MGHCGQQWYRFLKLTPLLHASLVKRRKLQWFGHVSRSSRLAKPILQGIVKGGRRQSRQKNWWEDNIREWIGLEFAMSKRAVENRGKWRKLVAKLSVVPNDPRNEGIDDDDDDDKVYEVKVVPQFCKKYRRLTFDSVQTLLSVKQVVPKVPR